MRRDTTSWFSHNLGMDMPMVAYGDRGFPLDKAGNLVDNGGYNSTTREITVVK